MITEFRSAIIIYMYDCVAVYKTIIITGNVANQPLELK